MHLQHWFRLATRQLTKVSRRNRKKVVRERRLHLETLEQRQLLSTFYVDGDNGSDSNNGTALGSSFATIQAGADAAQAGDTVLIRGGTYREEVDLPRSGNSSHPITFSAYNNEDVVISGGDLITGTWTQHSGDIWYATAPGNANGMSDGDANTVFVNGELKHIGRQGGENDPLDIDDWGQLPQGRLANNSNSFRVDDLGGFGNDFWNGARIRFHTNDFTIVERTITDFSLNGTITFDTPVGVVTGKQTNGYYIFDALQTVDQAGEWYKDDSNGRLYYHFGDMGPGYNPNTDANLVFEFKQRGYGFDARGRDHIHIKDIEFRGVSIETDGNTDFNVYDGNRFYAYDRGNFGRFFLNGSNNILRDNELSHTWSSFVTVGGFRNEIVNNFIHTIGFPGTTRAISAAGAEELLFSHNTVRNFARSFMDGYPTRSEIAYNVFEDGGNLSWDTGVFDADGGNGDSSYSIVHHNVFRNTEARGIFEAFYGRNNNLVIHHNLFHDFTNTTITRPVLRSYGLDFRQAYHNTIISSVGSAPSGELDAREAIQTRYNNNLQISLERMEALGVDLRGNYNYSTADFTNFFGDVYTLAPGSGAIDTGIVIPGVNDNFVGAAPDAGAFEFGATAWTAGHNFANEPNPTFNWQALPGTNLYRNGQFLEGIGDWTIISGSPNSSDRNSWNLQQSGAPLTGTFRTQSVEFLPGYAMQRSFTGLTPNTAYTVGVAARVVNRLSNANQINGSFGTVSTNTHRGEGFVTGLSPGEWVRYNNVDFGDPGQYDLIDLLHIENPLDSFGDPVDGVGVQVRIDSSTGPIIADFTELNGGTTDDRWRATRVKLAEISGVHDIYVSTTGSNAANVALGSFRLLKEAPPTDDLLTMRATSSDGETVSIQFGHEDWEPGYEELTFTTGPAATSATVTFENTGRLDAYLDRFYLIEGDGARGGEVRNVSSLATAELSLSDTTSAAAPGILNGNLSDNNETGDHSESWIQVDLGEQAPLHSIKLSPPTSQPDRMSNFRVSVWDADPRSGGVELWNQDFLTHGQSLSAGESLSIHSDTYSNDGSTTLKSITGRFVRVQLLGQNNAGNDQLAVGEIKVYRYGETNIALTDGVVSQSSTDGSFVAENANDGDSATMSSTQAGVNNWWQVRFAQGFSIGEIEIVNRDDAQFTDLSNFTVSVWDEDPSSGGTKLWENTYFTSGSVGQGESLVIDGGEIGTSLAINGSGTPNSNTMRLASAHEGRVVRIQQNGPSNRKLSLAEVRVKSSDAAPSPLNLAQAGTASQSQDFYGDVADDGFAEDANDGVILPVVNFTSALQVHPIWWQVDLERTAQIDQIAIFNRTDAASRIDDVIVSVWDDDPDNGGSQLWSRQFNYSDFEPTYSTIEIGPGGALLINGSTNSSSGSGARLDAVQGARYVRLTQTKTQILSLAEVQVWSNNADQGENVTVNTSATQFDYDFGTALSPVQSGRTRISPLTTGDISWDAPVNAADSGTAGDLDRDFVYGSHERTLRHKLQNGLWEVSLRMGEANQSHENMRVVAEDGWFSGGNTTDIASPVGSFTLVTGQAVVTDGELELTFSDLGGPDPNWVVNSLSLIRLGDAPAIVDTSLTAYDYDLGAKDSTVGPGYELISPETYNDIEWTGTVSAGSTATGGSIAGDFVTAISPATLEHLIANGVWDVTITSGHADNAYDNLSVSAEGEVKIADLDSTAGQFVEQVFRVQVSDGSLSLQFADNGGVTPDWVINRISLAKVSDLPLFPGDFNADQEVNGADLADWQAQYGTDGAADANLDRQVSGFDFLTWQRNKGAGEIVVTTLIDNTAGNGSFENWTGSTGLVNTSTQVLTNSSAPATLPGWTAQLTTGVGGWVRTSAFVPSDGTAYALANDSALVTFTSDVFAHSVAENDTFTLSFDVGSSNGIAHDFTAEIVLGGITYNLGTVSDGTLVSSGGGSLNTLTFSYTATAADAGTSPQLILTMDNAGGSSLAFLDNVQFQVETITGPSALAAISSSSVAALVATLQSEPSTAPPVEQPYFDEPDLPVLSRFQTLATEGTAADDLAETESTKLELANVDLFFTTLIERTINYGLGIPTGEEVENVALERSAVEPTESLTDFESTDSALELFTKLI